MYKKYTLMHGSFKTNFKALLFDITYKILYAYNKIQMNFL